VTGVATQWRRGTGRASRSRAAAGQRSCRGALPARRGAGDRRAHRQSAARPAGCPACSV